MKLAVLSCIHGNYEALNAVLSDVDEQKADRIFCLGDLVGYGPHPNAVVEMINRIEIVRKQIEDLPKWLRGQVEATPIQVSANAAKPTGRPSRRWMKKGRLRPLESSGVVESHSKS